jgi:hypothetical protein
MAMGRKLGAICICIENPQFEVDDFDYRFGSLSEFAHFITQT